MEPPPFFPPPLSVHDFWVSGATEAERGPQGYLALLLMPFHSTLFARLIVNSTHRLPELTCRMSRWWRKRSRAMGGWRVWPSEASPGASCCGTSDQDIATQNGVCCSVAWTEAHKALCSSPTAACWAIWVEWQELSYLGNAESVCMSETFVGSRGGEGVLGFWRLVMEMNLISYYNCLCVSIVLQMCQDSCIIKNMPKHFFLIESQISLATCIWNDWQLRRSFDLSDVDTDNWYR